MRPSINRNYRGGDRTMTTPRTAEEMLCDLLLFIENERARFEGDDDTDPMLGLRAIIERGAEINQERADAKARTAKLRKLLGHVPHMIDILRSDLPEQAIALDIRHLAGRSKEDQATLARLIVAESDKVGECYGHRHRLINLPARARKVACLAFGYRLQVKADGSSTCVKHANGSRTFETFTDCYREMIAE